MNYFVLIFTTSAIFCSADQIVDNWLLGNQALKNGNYDDATYYFSYCLDNNSELYSHILIDRGLANSLSKNYSEALEDFQDALTSLAETKSPYQILYYLRTLKSMADISIKQNNFEHFKEIINKIDKLKNHLHLNWDSLLLIKYSQEEMDQEREAAERELQKFYNEAYEAAKNMLNLNLGESTDHMLHAGEHAIEAWRHTRELEKMHKENSKEK